MITVVGTAIFFVLNDGVHGYELWTSNGTSEGLISSKIYAMEA